LQRRSELVPIIGKAIEGNSGANRIKNTDYYTGPWSREPVEPRYLGLTAVQFDIAVLALIAAAALAVWLFVFGGTTTARDYLGVETAPTVAVSQQVAPTDATAQQPADAAAPVPVEQSPAVAAPPAEPTLNDLIASSAQALDDVQSFRGRFQMTMAMNGESVNSGGDMLFQAPDKMHMTMNIGGQTYEMLALLPNMYLNVPHQGWYALDGQTLGFSPEVLSEYMNNRGLFDYQAEAETLSGVAQLPDEEIDGVLYAHFQGTLDFKTLQQAVGPDLLDPTVGGLENISGPVQVDILLDKTTHLPRRHTVTMDLNANGTTISMDMRMAFTEYNGSVTIPDAPEDARPFDTLATDNPPPQID
jgi:hypothetical protein